MTYQFKYDSTHGKYPGTVDYDLQSHHMTVDGKKIKIFMEADPANIPWKQTGADIIVEATGSKDNALLDHS